MQLASTLQARLPRQAVDTTATEWLLELQAAEALNPALQLPVSVPNDAKRMLPTTLPSGEPMSAIWFSAASTQVAGGPGGGTGAGHGTGAMARIVTTATRMASPPSGLHLWVQLRN